MRISLSRQSRFHWLLLGGCCLVMSTMSPLSAEEPAKDAKFQKIYNEKNLEGWEVYQGDIKSWQANGNELSCVKEGGGWLRTKKIYSDYVLRLDYKLPKDGNSGVGIRIPPEGLVHQAGMEIQLLDDDAPMHKDLKAAQYTGSIYYQAPAKRGAPKPPGEWNTMEITCAGQHVTIVLNGQVINDVHLDKFTKAEDPKTYSPLADRPQVGFIALQSHGSRVDFRNVEVKNLMHETPSGLQYYDIKVGEGPTPPRGGQITADYTGWFTNWKQFDSSRGKKPLTIGINDVIPGWTEGMASMKVGGHRKLIIPPKLGYGSADYGPIPGNSTLIFDVELLGAK